MDKKQIVTAIVLTQVLYTQQLGSVADYQKPLISPVVKSLILPGWGEYSLGNQIRGRIFVLSETMLLLAILGSYSVSKRQDTEFKAYAAEHAGISPVGKDRQFWVDIGNYDTIEDYNAEHLRNREMDALYPEDLKWSWVWDSSENRKAFEKKRIQSDQLKLAASFGVGALVLNHVVSAIDALYLTRVKEDQSLMVEPFHNLDVGSVGYAFTFRF